MLARCRVHEVSQEWGCEWGSSYMNESIHSVSSHDCRFLPSRMRGSSLVITQSQLSLSCASLLNISRNLIQRPPSLQCRHSVRPRPARPMLTAPPCTRRRPVCRMSTSRGSGNDFAARPAQQPQHLHGAPIIMRVQHPAQGRRTEVSSMLQHVQ